MHGVRLFHISDTHLGHQQYARTNEQGLNAREVDLYEAFHKAIDLAVAQRPDLVVHAGDLFDGVRPGNRALACAMEGFLKLSRAGIPTVVIAGNHEQPRLRETGSPLRLFAHLPGIHVACQGRRETFEVATAAGPVRVHAVPQCADNETLAREVQEAPVGGHGLDVLVVHGSVPSLPAFAHAESNDQSLDPAWFAPFHYVALGHYHGMQQVAPNAWYCGAPERISIAEAHQPKGFLDVRVGPGGPEPNVLAARPGTTANAGAHGAALALPTLLAPSDGHGAAFPSSPSGAHASGQTRGQANGQANAQLSGQANVHATHVVLDGRTYADLPAVDCAGLTASDVKEAGLAALARVPAGAVARLRLSGLDPALRATLDVRALRDAAAHALHLDLKTDWADQAVAVRGAGEFASLATEFERFAARQEMSPADRAAILAAARRLLEAA